jgi:hypothetical protein
VARFLHEAGGKVIAIADRKGATLNEKGLDIPRLTGAAWARVWLCVHTEACACACVCVLSRVLRIRRPPRAAHVTCAPPSRARVFGEDCAHANTNSHTTTMLVAGNAASAGHMARGGSLTDYEGGGPIFSGTNFLTIPCDVLVPAALGGVITHDVAQRLQCKVCVRACVCACWRVDVFACVVRS